LRAPKVRRDRGAGHPRDDYRVDERRELPDRGQDEEAAEAVERPEQDQEVRRLQPRGLISERDRRQQHRKPAQPIANRSCRTNSLP
jgi:hypothetical protein